MNELISIIVPVYKTEKYLEKCVDSILQQRYENIEVLLIDDGSPDNAGKLCETFAKADHRIRVIHQENGGLSSARNTGIAQAQGSYLAFVDSDDYIAPDMLFEMMNALQESNSDIAICGIKRIYSDKEVVDSVEHKICYSKKTALYLLLMDKEITSVVCNKLYKKELFDGLYFPVGRIFEDTLFTYKTFEKAKRIVRIPYVGYNYIRHDDSILGKWPFRVEAEFCRAKIERYYDVVQRFPEFEEVLVSGVAKAVQAVKSKALECNREEYMEHKSLITEHLAPTVMKMLEKISASECLSKRQRIRLKVFYAHPDLYRKGYRMMLPIRKHCIRRL